jgi:lipopolysaccharide export system permease protein
MSVISRYILADLIGWFLIFVVGLTLLMVVLLVGQEAWRMNLGLAPTLRLIPFILPTALVFAVPGTILFTVCLVYGRMSADNEVTAAKSAGISPMALLWPAFGLSFLLSVLAVWLNDVAFSWGQAGIQRVILQSVEEITYGTLRTQRSFATSKFSISVKGVEGRQLILPTMRFQPAEDVPQFTLTARVAELRSNLDRGTLSLILEDCEVDRDNGLHGVIPGTTIHEIPLRFASTRELKEDSPTQLPMTRFDEEIVAQKATIERLEQALAAEAGLALVTGDFHALSEATWKPRRKALTDARTRLFRLQTEPWRRWASGFSCLCFVMVGAPLAILWRRADVMTTFFVCFFPILIVYYPLFLLGLDRAKLGTLPPQSVWAANLVLVGIGLWLLRRVIRY